jgi:hypothetical protein
MRFSDRQGPRAPLGFLIPLGFVVVVAVCAAASLALPAGVVRVTAMGVAVVAFAGWARSLTAASATAVTAWFFATGFLVNAAGELTFASPDLVRLGAFAGAGLVGSAFAVSRDLRAGPKRVRTEAYCSPSPPRVKAMSLTGSGRTRTR